MTPRKPEINVPGDTAERILHRNGYIFGYDNDHVVWRFGFDEGSPQAKAFGCASLPFWVLASEGGHVRKTFVGKREELPHIFAKTLKDR